MTLTAPLPPALVAIHTKASKLLAIGERSGNYALVTSSHVCRALATMDPATIHTTILEEMGIRCKVTVDRDIIRLDDFYDRHSITHIMNACRGTFDVLSGMAADGRKSILITLPHP